MSDFLPLAGLALVDSLSAGTLVIPIALIFMWRRVRVGLLGTYLATIATAYFGLGVALLLGFDAAVTRLSGVSETDWFRWVTLVLGAGLFVFGVFSPNPKKHTATQSAGAEVPEGRASRLAKSASLSVTGMAGLALGAAVVEAATMLPYLGAMGIIQSMSFGFSLDPPICLMSGGSLGFERGRDEWAGGSVPAFHRSLPHFACQGLLHDSGLGPPSKGGLIRLALSGVAPTLIATAVRTPSPTARLSADAGTASWPGERSGPGCR